MELKETGRQRKVYYIFFKLSFVFFFISVFFCILLLQVYLSNAFCANCQVTKTIKGLSDVNLYAISAASIREYMCVYKNTIFAHVKDQ